MEDNGHLHIFDCIDENPESYIYECLECGQVQAEYFDEDTKEITEIEIIKNGSIKNDQMQDYK